MRFCADAEWGKKGKGKRWSDIGMAAVDPTLKRRKVMRPDIRSVWRRPYQGIGQSAVICARDGGRHSRVWALAPRARVDYSVSLCGFINVFDLFFIL